MTMFPPATIHYLPNNGSPPATTNKHGVIGSPPPGKQQGDQQNMVVALRWLTAIQEATQCLRDRPQLSEDDKPSSYLIQATEHSLQYLMKLEEALAPLEPKWDSGPTMDPPKFVPYQVQPGQGGATTTNKKKKKGRTANRYSLFEESEDEEDSEEQMVGGADDDIITGKTILTGSSRSTCSILNYDDLLEAGDVPTLNRIAHFPTGNTMGMRRLMIRIVTAQSELFAYQASVHRRRQAWTLGAQNCHASLCKIHQGLMLADSEISRCFALGGDVMRERQPLMEDADIVEVAVKCLTKERDSFVHKALVAKHQLIRKLEAAYIGRYNARMRLGDKWKNANKPRNKVSHHSKLRDQNEDKLVEIQMALDNLTQWDTRTLLDSANHLKLRLNPRGSPLPKTTAHPKHRSNGKRPMDLSGRVDLTLYPDPTFFGWHFTGSHVENGNQIEFFEKEGLLLDWHYAVGELALSWKHLSSRHRQTGKVGFFRSEGPVQSDFYMDIIQSRKPWEVSKKYKATKGNSWASVV